MYKYKSTSIIKDVIIKYKYKEKYKSPESLLDCSRFEPLDLHVYTLYIYNVHHDERAQVEIMMEDLAATKPRISNVIMNVVSDRSLSV